MLYIVGPMVVLCLGFMGYIIYCSVSLKKMEKAAAKKNDKKSN